MIPAPLLLLVDDAPEIALIVQRLAARSGQEVRWCQDVPSAWQRIQQGDRPDLVLLDHHLPGPSGLELLRLLRADATVAAMAVALFSGWDRSEDICAGLEAGADYVACKDLLATPAAWQHRVSAILAGPSGRAAGTLLMCRESRPSHPPLTGEEALASLNQALKLPCVRQMGTEVLRVLLRRAVARRSVPGAPDAWLHPGGALDRERALRDWGPAAVAFAAALAEQMWRAVGDEVLEPLRLPRLAPGP